MKLLRLVYVFTAYWALITGCTARLNQSPYKSDIDPRVFLFFEIKVIPPANDQLQEPMVCGALLPGLADFPSYFYDREQRSLFSGVIPQPYAIAFTDDLRAIMGEVAEGWQGGTSSSLVPIYALPYDFEMVPGGGYGYSVDLRQIGSMRVVDIMADGVLELEYDNKVIRLAPGTEWSEAINSCGERLEVVNYGYLEIAVNTRSLQNRR